MKRITFVRVDA